MQDVPNISSKGAPSSVSRERQHYFIFYTVRTFSQQTASVLHSSYLEKVRLKGSGARAVDY